MAMAIATAKKLTLDMIINILDQVYDKAINGIPGFDSAQEMAESYLSGDGTLREKANSLIQWQIKKAATSGFLTGIGGIIIMPVSIPANITSVMYVQIRMIAAIAYMSGHDLKNDQVKALVYTCLAGNAAIDIFKDIGIVIGTKLSKQAIKSISGKTIISINKKIGFRLLTKFGEKGAINLGKAVPLAGGIIGSTFDSIATKKIGNIARDTFIGKNT